METTTPTSQQPQTPSAASQLPTPPRRSLRPRASITETADGFTIQVEMPGVTPDGLEITFEDGDLTLVGRRAAHGDGHEVLHRESHAADYRRVFEVDNTIDAARIGARLDQGLLTLSLPKAESAKPRRIEIDGRN